MLLEISLLTGSSQINSLSPPLSSLFLLLPILFLRILPLHPLFYPHFSQPTLKRLTSAVAFMSMVVIPV